MAELDVLVLGGGFAGLSTAFRLSRGGKSVMVLDLHDPRLPTAEEGAGLMGFHYSGDRPGPRADLALESAVIFPDFLREVEEDSDLDLLWNPRGTLCLAYGEEELRGFRSRLAWQEHLGSGVVRIRGAAAMDMEPGLAPEPLEAFHLAGDGSLNPHRLESALRKACRRRGVEWREAASPIPGQRSAAGPALEEMRRSYGAQDLVVTGGIWPGLPGPESGGGRSLVASIRLPRDFRIEYNLRTASFFIVPGEERLALVGWTEELPESGAGVTAAELASLMEALIRLLPAAAGAELLGAWVTRGTSAQSGLPVLGSLGRPGIFAALDPAPESFLTVPRLSYLAAGLVLGPTQLSAETR